MRHGRWLPPGHLQHCSGVTAAQASSRWERATPAQRDLLRTLANIGGDGPAAVADISKAMGKPRTSDISVARNELIKKGLVYASERGLLAFTVPGMHDFIDRQP